MNTSKTGSFHSPRLTNKWNAINGMKIVAGVMSRKVTENSPPGTSEAPLNERSAS